VRARAKEAERQIDKQKGSKRGKIERKRKQGDVKSGKQKADRQRGRLTEIQTERQTAGGKERERESPTRVGEEKMRDDGKEWNTKRV
jgi:hypothetical protein